MKTLSITKYKLFFILSSFLLITSCYPGSKTLNLVKNTKSINEQLSMKNMKEFSGSVILLYNLTKKPINYFSKKEAEKMLRTFKDKFNDFENNRESFIQKLNEKITDDKNQLNSIVKPLKKSAFATKIKVNKLSYRFKFDKKVNDCIVEVVGDEFDNDNVYKNIQIYKITQIGKEKVQYNVLYPPKKSNSNFMINLKSTHTINCDRVEKYVNLLKSFNDHRDYLGKAKNVSRDFNYYLAKKTLQKTGE